MTAQQVDTVYSVPISLRRNDFKFCPLPVRRDTGQLPVATLRLTHGDHSRTAPFDDRSQPLDVAIHEQATLLRKRLGQGALLAKHPVQVTKKFQVLATDAGQHSDGRADD